MLGAKQLKSNWLQPKSTHMSSTNLKSHRTFNFVTKYAIQLNEKFTWLNFKSAQLIFMK